MNNVLNFILGLAIIILATKLLGLLFRRWGLPQVLGYIVAGVIIGPAIFGDFLGWSIIGTGTNTYGALVDLTPGNGGEIALEIFSKIGVIIIMFISGMETDLKEIKKTGVISTVIACVGVAVPMAFGFLCCLPFALTEVLNTEDFTFTVESALFIGVILTATSVAITVSVLRELGKLQGRLGTIILSAAIIDDIIGIVVLSIVLGVCGGESSGGLLLDVIMSLGVRPALEPLVIVLLIIAFFALAIGMGIFVSRLFKYLDKKWPQTHRIPILSLVMCLVYAYVAEAIFGVADISGAFVAGIILATNHRNAHYVDKKLDVTSYLFFSPVFFASIGINMSLSGLFTNGWLALMILIVVVVAIVAKIIGCGGTAALFKMDKYDSAIVGVGMSARGEVALIVTSAGIMAELLDSSYYVLTVMIILTTAVLAPVLLKVLFNKKDKTLNTAIELQGGAELAHNGKEKYAHSVNIFVGGEPPMPCPPPTECTTPEVGETEQEKTE